MFKLLINTIINLWKWSNNTQILMFLEAVLSSMIQIMGVLIPVTLVKLLMGDDTSRSLIMVLLLISVKLFTNMIKGHISIKIKIDMNKYRHNLSCKIYNCVMNESLERFESVSFQKIKSKALNASTNSSRGFGNFHSSLSDIVSSIGFVLFASIFLAHFSSLISVAISLAILFLSGILNYFAGNITFKTRVETHEINANQERINANLVNSLTAHEFGKDLRVFSFEKILFSKKEEIDNKRISINEKLYTKNLKRDNLMLLVELFRMCIILLFIINMIRNGNLGVPEIMLAFTMLHRVSSYLDVIVISIGKLKYSLVDIDDYWKLIDEVNDVEVVLSDFEIMDIANVNYRYPSNKIRSLMNITLKIKRGEKIAIVGENGSGKSTLVDIMLGLRNPDNGILTINGLNYQDVGSKKISEYFSVGFQKPVIFPDTFERNITLNNGTDDAINDLFEDITGLSDSLTYGKKTILGKKVDSHGVELSGGEQAKLSIARALYQDREILILDEPYANLDSISQKEFHELIFAGKENKTLIMISHKLNHLKDFDKIYVMKQGRIIESGNHEHLIELRGEYYRLVIAEKENIRIGRCDV